MRVALLTYNARSGDAIGNLVAEKVTFFRERGAYVRVFLQDNRQLHPAVRQAATVVTAPEGHADAQAFLAEADLVIVDYSQYYSLLSFIVNLPAGRPRLVFDYHGVTPPALWSGACPPAVADGARRRNLVWSADAALAHSRFAQAELCQATGFPSEHTFILGYPLGRDQFTPGAPRRELRRALGLGRATLALFVGRLAPNKCAGLLVEAVAALRHRQPPVHAVFVGDHSDIYQREAVSCQHRARVLGIADRLHLLGQVSHEQLLDAYHSADVLVVPSVHEGFCLPVLEAMACGVPVVAARAAALPETVGDAGLLFAPGDVTDFVGQLTTILEETTAAKEVRRQRGFARCAEFERPRWQDQFGKVVESILHAPPRPREPRPAMTGLEILRQALNEGQALRQLPDDYYDVTEGWGAALKRGIKRKLLGNFKQAYVDVLSRQQSALNEHLLTALHELTEECAGLRQSVDRLEARLAEFSDGSESRQDGTPSGSSSRR